MKNNNPTAKHVEKEPEAMLRELVGLAATHPVFARKLQERGIVLDMPSLRERAKKRRFSKFRFWRQWIPQIAESDIDRSVRSDLVALMNIKDVVVEET